MTLLRPITAKSASSLFGKFMRCAFGFNIQKSLQPFADAYYNFGRALVETFNKVGLIDNSHPWMRRSMRARPVEVLTYACAKANWKKPYALSTVMAASITMMVVCGALATTSLVTSSMLGAGQAYASMFTAPSPGTDLALKYMSNSFGVTIPGVPMATLDVVVSGFQQMMGLYSMGMLVLAGFILLYIIMSAIAATAHEGRFGGSGFNQVWAPIRLIVAIGLLVPLPMAGGYNGYNSGQYIVMQIAQFGSALATNLWIPFATALANRGDVIGTPNVEPAAAAVRGVLLNEFCMARYNIAVSTLGLSEPAVGITQLTSGGRILNYYTTSADVQNSYCGMTYYEKSVAANTMAASISNGYETAYNNMKSQVAAFANTLNGPNYIDIFTSLPAAGNENATKTFFLTNFINIVDQYQHDLATAINATVTTQGAQAAAAMTTTVTQQGWAGASVWFNTIARLNSEVMSAARGIPTSQEPSLTSTAGAISGPNTCSSTTTALTCTVAKGLELIKQFADNLPALYGATPTTTGAGNVGSVATPAVLEGLSQGLDNSGSVGGNLTGAVGTAINWVMTSTFAGGPFGNIGMGAEANLSQLNPLAQLAQIGDWLLNKSMIMLGLAAVVPGGASLLLMGLGVMGFSAGILLYYVTPLMPFIRMLFGVAGWLLNILEAVIAIPLVAVAHLNTQGQGVSGDLARTAYFMVLSIFLRPALLIVGMIIAMMMFSVGIGILNDLYKSAVTGFMGTATGNANGGLSIIMYTVMYVAIAYGLCNLCFKLIEEIPNHAMRWISQQSAREITQDEGVARALTHTGEGFIGIGRGFSGRAAGGGAGAKAIPRGSAIPAAKP